MSPMRKGVSWAAVDWSVNNAALARRHKVSREAVRYARGRYSKIPNPSSHGGKRKGAGRKPQS